MSGRIRTIKPEVLEDEIAAALSDSAWRLWISLWVLADDRGNVRAGDKYLGANVWQDTTRSADEPLYELIDRGFIAPYAVRCQRYAHINGWEKHQRVDNASKPRVPTPDQDDGTWDQGLSDNLAEFRGGIREPKRLPESPPLARRAPAQSSGETPTPTTDPDPESPGGDDGSSMPRDAPSEPFVAPESATGPVAARLPPEPPANDPDRRAPVWKLSKSTIATQKEFWFEAYERAIIDERGVGGRWMCPTHQISSLVQVIEAYCEGPDRRDIAAWLERDVWIFARAVRELGAAGVALSALDPNALQRWHNRPDAALAKTGPPEGFVDFHHGKRFKIIGGKRVEIDLDGIPVVSAG